MRRIEILAFPDVQLLDVAGPLQVFASTNDLLVNAGKPAHYQPVAVGAQTPIVTSSALTIGTSALSGASEALDTLIVPGGWGVYRACEDQQLVSWIAQRSKTARRTASVCSGAFLLASTGLLDGRRAVTHWQRCGEFRKHFPKVRLDPDPIFIQDGAIWTSAGVTAGIDLALALVENDLGREVALAVARQLVVFLKRPGGQSQFSAALTLQDESGRFDGLHAWMMENITQDLSLADLAEKAGMSLRSFSRHYREQTGVTPSKALEEMRLETARRLLEQAQPVSRAARRAGFGSEETLRRLFQRRFGVSPQAYRERFMAAA
ncbi:GlxA family transcriptional regulator [uncultured Agrobacterium sp.]|uniref:GlxA family transcriptional regulator n=1 Tax=uncultured Agrobacterium sp. TaxID=157277 RepID=UPI0025D72815|nr:GlxA family transcriptional regulator [uncultured Agrobacterium sp.]